MFRQLKIQLSISNIDFIMQLIIYYVFRYKHTALYFCLKYIYEVFPQESG